MSKQIHSISPLVDFIGIGAAKSGTTWLADCLRLHPDIFIPKEKELDYFNAKRPYYNQLPNINHTQPVSWYHASFKEKNKTQIAGEFSPAYLNTLGTAQAIYDYNPHVKIIAILRSPLEQLQSLYLFFRQKGFIKPMSFEEAIFTNDEMLEGCFYYKQLKPYFDLFPREQIKIVLYDELKADRKAFFLEILSFLGVSPFLPENFSRRSNVTQQARMPALNFAIDRIRIFLHRKNQAILLRFLMRSGIVNIAEWLRDHVNKKPMTIKPDLEVETAQKVLDIVQKDVHLLAHLLDRDLRSWLIPK
jgi:hypothetical protein